MADLHSQKSKTESVGSSIDGDVTDDEYDLYDYYNEGACDLTSLIGCIAFSLGDLSETEEERNEAVARKDLEHYDFTCTAYNYVWDQIKEQVDKIHQELKVWILRTIEMQYIHYIVIDFIC